MVEGILLAHPFNSSFDKVHYCTTDDEAAQVATGETIKHLRAESTNLQKTALAAESGIESVENTVGVAHAAKANITVYTSTFYIGLNISLKDGKLLLFLTSSSENATAVTGETRKLDISWPSQEFYDICRHSPGYNEDNMNVSIKHIRKYGPMIWYLLFPNVRPPGLGVVSNSQTMYSMTDKVGRSRRSKNRRSAFMQLWSPMTA